MICGWLGRRSGGDWARVILNKTFYNLRFKQEVAAAAPVPIAFSYLTILEEAYNRNVIITSCVNYIITICINENAVINDNYVRLQDLILFFKRISSKCMDNLVVSSNRLSSPDVDDSCRTQIIFTERTAEPVRLSVFDLVVRTWCSLLGISCRD